MIIKIRNYVDHIFEGKPKTKKILELKDELVTNLIEKYNDLLKEKTDEEAYNIVIASIGDIDELISELNESVDMNSEYMQRYQNKKAKYIAISVMLYILSILPVIYFEEALGYGEFGVMIMLTMVAIATGLLVYVGVSKPKYLKQNDTIVEEFKEWNSQNKQQDKVKLAIVSSVWLFIVALYFVLSFTFYNWHYSWVIFVIGAAINQIINAIFEMRRK
jgi:uncharacterized membrane protein